MYSMKPFFFNNRTMTHRRSSRVYETMKEIHLVEYWNVCIQWTVFGRCGDGNSFLSISFHRPEILWTLTVSCWFLVAANTVLGWPMRLNCGALAQFWLDVFLFISLCCCANGPLSAIWIQCRAFLMQPLHFFHVLCPDSLHVCGAMRIRR